MARSGRQIIEPCYTTDAADNHRTNSEDVRVQLGRMAAMGREQPFACLHQMSAIAAKRMSSPRVRSVTAGVNKSRRYPRAARARHAGDAGGYLTTGWDKLPQTRDSWSPVAVCPERNAWHQCLRRPLRNPVQASIRACSIALAINCLVARTQAI